MSEKELGRALLELDSQKLAGEPTSREQTWRILEADRRRVWRWTAVTIGLWSAAILMILLMLIGYGLVFPLQAKLAGATDEEPAGALKEQGRIRIEDLTPEQRELAKFKAQVVFQMITVGVTFSVGILSLAALATVFLVVASRRATLRQINASLLEISTQLKELRQASVPPKQQT